VLSHTLPIHFAHVVPCLHFRIVSVYKYVYKCIFSCAMYLFSFPFWLLLILMPFPVYCFICVYFGVCCVYMYVLFSKIGDRFPAFRVFDDSKVVFGLRVCIWRLRTALFVAYGMYVCTLFNMPLYVYLLFKNWR
jgi:hypothetical protein